MSTTTPDDANADLLKVSILGKESIHCGFHLIPYIVHTVLTTLPSSTYVLITDTNVAKFHLPAFLSEFNAAISSSSSSNSNSKSKSKPAPRFLNHVISPGETSKSREGKAAVEDFLLINRCTRDTVLLALGGGVIGDLIGFVAATFMRGVRFCQIPTTLLAMVDSSVGGKTAIDTPHGKNLIGAFWQPEYIFIDAAFLETLPPREFSNGMAEVVKTAAIWTATDFALLESGSSSITSAAIQSPPPSPTGRILSTRTQTQSLLLSIIHTSISVKAYIVTADERETTGLRNLVNFGHTIGHAIEAILTPQILHGECVSIGMVLEAEVARAMGRLSQSSVGRLRRCLEGFGLPVSIVDKRIQSVPAARTIGVQKLLDIMRIDKKNSGDEKRVVILDRIGHTYEQKASVIPDKVIAKVLSDAVKVVSVEGGEGGIKGEVRMSTPGSKSISNRALVLAALGKGSCKLKNLLHSDDTQVMMAALLDLKGAKFTWEDDGDTLVVEGGSGSLSAPPEGKEVYLGNAGTAARFLTTVCTLVQAAPSSPSPVRTVITGNARMKQRPIGPLVDALRANGSEIDYVEAQGSLPLSIAPNNTNTTINKGTHIKLAASVSSQYVSSVLLCAPYMSAGGEPVTLELTGGQVVSQAYIDMTIAMMRSFGITVTRDVDPSTGAPLDVYRIPQGVYTNPSTYNIESDASSATYPLAIAAITGTACTIENIGFGSLQGDARFAKEVLEPMGCEVVQSETETTVRGPKRGQLKPIGTIDMEPMTDAFLTASVLAAVATALPKEGRELGDEEGKGRRNVTRIIGISNQRVKECNRIKAMMDELAKFGVETRELEDGLEIYGKCIEELKRGASVHCYDDHRVAMAFSVLGTVVPDTIIEEKRCVEKTWPNWWDDLENKIGLKVEGIDLASIHPLASASASAQNTTAGSVLLIGMRGSGKSFIGKLAASILDWPLIDADQYFEQKLNISVREFVHQHGWPAFRAAEFDILKELLAAYPTEYVISLGGGIVETAIARDLLKSWKQVGYVVHIVREIDEIIKYLGEESARPAYGEPITDVFRRRSPWFIECCNYEFVNHTGELKGDVDPSTIDVKTRMGTKNEVTRFFKHITGQKPNLATNLAPGKRSYFLSLTYPDITPALPNIEELTIGVDAIELRVDLLRAPNDFDTFEPYIPPVSYVANQTASLRRVTSLPIVFTVRTVSQGGAFPDHAEKEAFDLLNLAVCMGVEYIDVEITWTEKRIVELSSRKGSSQIIASWHDHSGNMKWNGAMVKEKYEIASRLGDIVKVIGKAECLADNFALFDFVSRVNSVEQAKPIIAINMGVEGQMSRILNPTFSPVSHPLLPTKAAPGQLSFVEIQKALHLLGQLPTLRFFLFGSPISQSPSPTLHNTAFQALGLPHIYDTLETSDAGEEIRATIVSPNFGGASVTIPLKVKVIPLLDKLSPAAEAIGAVNTIIPITTDMSGSHRILYGDNTDWCGIYECIRSRLPSSGSLPAALVIGAGGTARAAVYALQALGANHIYLFNRTQSNAQELADFFPNTKIDVIDKLGKWPNTRPSPNVIISTVPASVTTLDETQAQDAVYLPPTLFDPDHDGVAMDVAYRPAETPLLTLARNVAKGWSTAQGIDMLLEQGYVQSEMWTGRKCPKVLMAEKAWGYYNSSE